MEQFKHLWHHYRPTLARDLLAGATGAIAGAPQAMGFALIAGISPLYGLYTAIVATIVGALTGKSTYMTVGPTNALALVVASTLMSFENASHNERLFVLTFLVGIFQLTFGIFHLGRLARFVSHAVMTGFITGAGMLIILGQLEHLTGYDLERSPNYLVGFWNWLRHLNAANGHTVIIGLTATIIIYVLHKTRYKSIATLVGLTVTTLMIIVFGWHDVAEVRDIAAIGGGLPRPIIPHFEYVPDLLVAALAIAVLASVQSSSLTEAIEEPDGSTPDIRRDLMGQGFANLAASVFQGMPSGGSLSRTAVNIAAGAKTRLANIIGGVFVALILVSLGSAVERIALAALAGHLVVAALSLIDPHDIMRVLSVTPSARTVMLATFISTLLFPLEYSVYVGVVLSLGLYVYTSADNIHVVRMVVTQDHHFREEHVPARLPDAQPVLLSVSGNLFFGAVKHLEELLPVPNGSRRPVVILRLRDNVYLGSTGIRLLERYADQLEGNGGKLILTGVSDPVCKQLARAGVMERFGSENIFTAGDTVFSATERALEYAYHWLEA